MASGKTTQWSTSSGMVGCTFIISLVDLRESRQSATMHGEQSHQALSCIDFVSHFSASPTFTFFRFSFVGFLLFGCFGFPISFRIRRLAFLVPSACTWFSFATLKGASLALPTKRDVKVSTILQWEGKLYQMLQLYIRQLDILSLIHI